MKQEAYKAYMPLAVAFDSALQCFADRARRCATVER